MCVTFTRKAASELRQRLKALDITGIRAETFHSFCYALINGYATRLGYRYPVNAYDEYLSSAILVDIMISYNLPYGKPAKNESLRMATNRVIRNAIKKVYENHPEEWIKIDEEYHHRLKTNNAVDYERMISETVRLLSTHEDVRSEVHNSWHHFMIDEFQDTSPDQMALIDLIDPKNLFIIGDVDQAIYSFRGATPENINEVVTRPGCELINLNINYRCPVSVIHHSNELISHNQNDIRLPAVPMNEADEGICSVRTYIDSWYGAASLVKDLLRTYQPRDIAVLCRDNGREHYPVGCYGVVQELKKFKIPFKRIFRDGSLWESYEVRNIIYTLNLVMNPDDRASWAMAVNFPFNRIDQKDRTEIKEMAVHQRINLLNASSIYNSETGAWATNLLFLNRDFNSTKSSNPSELLDALVAFMGWEKHFQPLTGRRFSQIIQRIKLQMKELAQEGKPELIDFIEWWLSRESINENPHANAVEVSTIHSYKGLQKPVVVIPGVEAGKFPKMSKKDLNLDEECRILYVAITRAEQECYLIYQDEASPFIDWAGFNTPKVATVSGFFEDDNDFV